MYSIFTYCLISLCPLSGQEGL